jgi:membrane protein implicated in regulation of membrane protease activity
VLFSFLIFVGTFILTVYGVEYIMDPFGKFLFINPVEIIGSIAFSIAYVTGIMPKIAIFLAVVFLSIPSIILVVIINRKLRKNKRKKY